MTFIGESLLAVSSLACLGVVGLLALQWLKTRYPEREVSSAMLWAEAVRRPSPRSLWSRFARPLSLLLPLVALLAGAMAVLEPVREGNGQAGMTVIVYETGCEARALELFGKLSPARRKLIWSEGGGIVTGAAHRDVAGLLEQEGRGRADRIAVSVLAQRLAGPGGLVVWLGGTPPPQLPDRCVFIACGQAWPAEGGHPLVTVRVRGAGDLAERLVKALPGVRLADREEAADCLIDMREGHAAGALEKLAAALDRTGLYEEGRLGHQQELPEEREQAVRGDWWSLTPWLFALAMLAYGADVLLWSRGRTV